MRVAVDEETCVLTGNCALAAERVFRLEDGKLHYEPAPAEGDHEDVREAALLCPVQAITVEE